MGGIRKPLFIALCSLLLVSLFASCSFQPIIQAPTSTLTFTPDTPSETPTPENTNTATVTITPSTTPSPTITPTSTQTFTPLPTEFSWIVYKSNLLSEIEFSCPTPKSLMLHSAFGSKRMVELADAIIVNGLQTMTYKDIVEGLMKGECPDQNTIVVSIDDLGTGWLIPDFREMISAFTERDLVLVLGVITNGPQAPLIWEYYQELDAKGIEIASHSVNHSNLAEIDEMALEEEIMESYRTICENLGTCPVSFILPYGAYDDRVIVTSEDYTFVVGIAGGLFFGDLIPYYVGRSGPYVYDQQITIERLEYVYDVNFIPTPTPE